MDKEGILKELQFKAIRSSGPGGQHANKVSSKVELTFDVVNSSVLSETEKTRISKKLASKLTNEGALLLQCDESRSQHKNKDLAVERFFALLEAALKVPKKRKASKPSKSAIEKRLKSKKANAEKKANRSKPEL
ncbi:MULTISPECIES: alternative ribosome rescue aminoacyl-tRNA hydrolase ArfB [Maribacter]|uniref:Alternative ribosome rescue aminoacyl-tRNA hydrolase ArfB n=1 Tax=Maribacter flavus TaxID=1658664 RepID=A0ABU7IES4_9FLAO|nr:MULTISPECIES: alternative ribosome rescue aminoacyl-tRNA hydrolase ArfB [Maribacter]MDC6404310.1 alternative ribosome rescue aminoacyl-tRNA hydrolase ArfB [Maribacter sp. PR66]MEE1971452.1 alternative ribosome rescue aminoacyl-tRNA hydrolase ArfB [Maribacter flavus]